VQVLEKIEAPLGAVMSPNHPLAGMQTVPLSHCASYPLIFADKSVLLHQTMMAAFAQADLKVEPTFRTNSIETMKYLAAAGRGIAFLSRFDIADEQRSSLLSYVRIRDRTVGSNVLSLVHRERRTLGVAAALFAAEIRSELHAMMEGARPRPK